MTDDRRDRLWYMARVLGWAAMSAIGLLALVFRDDLGWVW